MSKEYLIPHPNVPTSDIGISKMKDVTMLFNENFDALDSQVQTNASGISTLNDSKADADHNHDDTYAEKEHTHSMQEIDSLEANLASKAALVHTHDQYLTEIPTHAHQESEVDGLLTDLANKADLQHTHTMSDVQNLTTELANMATQTQLAQVESMIPDMSGLDEGKFVAAKQGGGLETPDNQPITTSGTITSGHAVKFVKDANDIVTVQDAGVYVPGAATSTSDTVLVTGKYESVESGNLIKGGDDVDVVDSNISASNVSSVVSAFTISNNTASIKYGNMPVGNGSNQVAQGNHTHAYGSASLTGFGTAAEKNVGDFAPSSTVSFPGFGGTGSANAASHSDHTHTHSAITDWSTATNDFLVGDDIGTTVQEHSDKLDALDTALDNNGKVPLTQLTGNISGHSGNCLVTIDTDGNLGHSGNSTYNAVQALKTDYEGASNAIPYSKFTTTPQGSKFVKTSGTDRTLVEDSDFEGLSDDDPEDVDDTGSASPGESTEAARADHVHALPAMSGRTGDWTLTGTDLFDFRVPSGAQSAHYTLFVKGLKFDKYGRCLGTDDTEVAIATNIMCW